MKKLLYLTLLASTLGFAQMRASESVSPQNIQKSCENKSMKIALDVTNNDVEMIVITIAAERPVLILKKSLFSTYERETTYNEIQIWVPKNDKTMVCLRNNVRGRRDIRTVCFEYPTEEDPTFFESLAFLATKRLKLQKCKGVQQPSLTIDSLDQSDETAQAIYETIVQKIEQEILERGSCRFRGATWHKGSK